MPKPKAQKNITAKHNNLAKSKGEKNSSLVIKTQADLNRLLWNGVCNILRRDKAKGALQYVPEVAWMLFLASLDQRESDEQKRAAMLGNAFTPSLIAPYRWQDWAKPDSPMRAEY